MSDFNKPQHYWKIAEEYAKKKDKELRKQGKYYLDVKLAIKYIKFGSMLKHTAGDFGGVNFQFQEWQIIAIIDIFATKHLGGRYKDLRRYQRALFFMPKKNGKTEFTALLHILYFFIDSEKTKVQYTIGKSLNQAVSMRDAVVSMLYQEHDLWELVHSTKQPPRVEKRNGAFVDTFEALASDADNHEGKNVSFFTVDEGHTHPNKDMYQIVSNGTVGRSQPLEIHLSTAGYDMNGYFYRDIYSYAKKIKNGTIEDETFYQVMFELEDEDMKNEDFWKDPKMWEKVNPNLGVSPTWSGIEKEYKTALQSEQSRVAFITKHLNVWCDKAETWIKKSDFRRNQTPTDIKDFIGKKCYIGLDLATTRDIAALQLLFYENTEKGRKYTTFTYGWIPKDRLLERVRVDKVPYMDWLKKDLIKATDGNSIDYNYIEKEIIDLCQLLDVQCIAYDSYNAQHLVTNLINYDPAFEDLLVKFAQTASMFNNAIKEIEIATDKGLLNHGDNEVLNWQCQNVVLLEDSNGNRKMDKRKSIEKIDNMVALAMALGVCIADIELEVDNTSIYEEKDLMDL